MGEVNEARARGARGAFVVIGLAGVLGAVAWAALRGPSDPVETGPALRVGALVGELTDDDRAVRAGLELALAQLNATRGDQLLVELVIKDPGGSAQTAAQHLEALQREGVTLVADIVAEDWVEACELTLRQHEELIAATSNPAPSLLHVGGARLTKIAPAPSAEGDALGRWAHELQPQTPLVLHAPGPVGQARRDAFGRAWGSLSDSLVLEVTDVEAQRAWLLERVRTLQPDLLAILLPAASAEGVLAALGDALPAHVLLAEQVRVPEAARALAPRLRFVTCEADAAPGLAAFRARWSEAGHSGEPPLRALLAHDALQVLVRAAWVAGGEPRRTLATLVDTSYEGASGHVSFEHEGARAPIRSRRMTYTREGVAVPVSQEGGV